MSLDLDNLNNFSEDNTNMLDENGVWVKKAPPKDENDISQGEDSFDLDNILEEIDFPEVDSDTENTETPENATFAEDEIFLEEDFNTVDTSINDFNTETESLESQELSLSEEIITDDISFIDIPDFNFTENFAEEVTQENGVLSSENTLQETNDFFETDTESSLDYVAAEENNFETDANLEENTTETDTDTESHFQEEISFDEIPLEDNTNLLDEFIPDLSTIDITTEDINSSDETNVTAQESFPLEENTLENLADGFIDIDNFMQEEPTEIDINNFMQDSSSDSVEIDLGDFLGAETESIDLDDFLPTESQQKDDIVNDEPINMDLNFDDDFSDSAVADPTEQVENLNESFDAAALFEAAEETNFDDLFDNIVDESAPQEQETIEKPVDVTTESFDFDEVTEFDDLLSSITEESQSVRQTTAAPKKETPNYTLKIRMDDSMDSVAEIQEETISNSNAENTELPSKQEETMDDMSKELLNKIANELFSLRDEISTLRNEIGTMQEEIVEIQTKKNETTSLPTSTPEVQEVPQDANAILSVDSLLQDTLEDDSEGIEVPSIENLLEEQENEELDSFISTLPENSQTGFFSEDLDNEVIALSSDELSNILQSADVVEEIENEVSVESFDNFENITTDEEISEVASSFDEEVETSFEIQEEIEDNTEETVFNDEIAEEIPEEISIEKIDENFDEAFPSVFEETADETLGFTDDVSVIDEDIEKSIAEELENATFTEEELAENANSEEDVFADTFEIPSDGVQESDEPISFSDDEIIDEAFDVAETSLPVDDIFEEESNEENFIPEDVEITEEAEVAENTLSEESIENEETDHIVPPLSFDEAFPSVFEETADETLGFTDDVSVIDEDIEKSIAEELENATFTEEELAENANSEEDVFADTFEIPSDGVQESDEPISFSDDEIIDEAFDVAETSLPVDDIFEEESNEENFIPEDVEITEEAEVAENTLSEESIENEETDHIVPPLSFDEAFPSVFEETADETLGFTDDVSVIDEDIEKSIAEELENATFTEEELAENANSEEDVFADTFEIPSDGVQESDEPISFSDDEIIDEAFDVAETSLPVDDIFEEESNEENFIPEDVEITEEAEVAENTLSEESIENEETDHIVPPLSFDEAFPSVFEETADETLGFTDDVSVIDEDIEKSIAEELENATFTEEELAENANSEEDVFADTFEIPSDGVQESDEPISFSDDDMIDEDFDEPTKEIFEGNQWASLSLEDTDHKEISPAAEQVKNSTESNTQLPEDMKNEIKQILLYMDQLLENLPEEKIVEFAKSEYFPMYKKLFSDLGLT